MSKELGASGEKLTREGKAQQGKGRWRGLVEAARRIWVLRCLWDPSCPESTDRDLAESRGCLQPRGMEGI